MSQQFTRSFLVFLLAAGVATPALAEWVSVGSVQVGRGKGRAKARLKSEHDRPVKQIRLSVEEGQTVSCREVRAAAPERGRRLVYRGDLVGGQPATVDFRGKDIPIRAFDFECQPEARGPVTIAVEAELGEAPPAPVAVQTPAPAPPEPVAAPPAPPAPSAAQPAPAPSAAPTVIQAVPLGGAQATAPSAGIPAVLTGQPDPQIVCEPIFDTQGQPATSLSATLVGVQHAADGGPAVIGQSCRVVD
jgi:hypothetical protein